VGTELLDHLQANLSNAYTLERELGGGGMSRVFTAEERALCRRVVVKVLSPELAAGVSAERFKREILLTARLQHPHIIPILSAGDADGLPYYTMPFVEGESLRVRLMRTGAMSITDAVTILRDVAKALEFAHEKRVVHRDIKPDNILLAGNTAVVSDFGIGKALEVSRVGDDSEMLTELGIAVGTPQYMAPEQILGDPAMDHRADLYSFGCVAYELLAGEPPFAGRMRSAVLRAHIVETPTAVTAKRADIPEPLATLVERCLEKSPERRPACAREVIAILDTLTSGTGAHRLESPASSVPTVAVLPFVNLTADADNEHFADGLMDELITDLSMIRAIRVISRQSAMRLKGSDKDASAIGRELGARYVLTGSVRRAGANLRITAQLVDARADAQLWAEKFNGTLEDVFDIQERLSRQIVDALRLRLTPAEDQRIGERPIADVRAYEYYLLARQQIWGFTGSSLDRALQLVRRAQEIVGDNELLATAEGLIYWQYVNVGLVPIERYDELLEKAEVCVARVFALNPESSKGHGLRGAIRNNRADAEGATADFKRALALDPNDPEALLWLGYNYAVAGRGALARALMERLQQVDPLTSINLCMFGMVEMFDGRYDEALRWTQRSVDIDPTNPSHRMVHALMLAANGHREAAATLLDGVSHDASDMTWTRMAPAMAHALRGERDAVLRVMTPALRAAAWRDDIFSWWAADCLALVGEREAALEFVERVVSFGWINYPFLAQHEAFLAGARGEPRFARLLERVRRSWESFEA
jgi:serine/threonine protein kinase/tetratricopeptide (TPR) repeat protein